MPYIKAEERAKLDLAIDELIEILKDVDVDDRDGNVNYTLTRILMNALEPEDGWRYRNMQRVMGLLACMQQEIYRRVIGPYEDRAIGFNGDVGELHTSRHE